VPPQLDDFLMQLPPMVLVFFARASSFMEMLMLACQC